MIADDTSLLHASQYAIFSILYQIIKRLYFKTISHLKDCIQSVSFLGVQNTQLQQGIL
ncbi:hypothetical protein C8R11_105116 [Nitrosomonas aestuarii]|nr:hypothetical protein C8R11_105116 [Nitrosomonas aestuarii]